MNVRANERQRVYLDLTHVGRHVTGIERIAIELFEKVEFEDAEVVPVRAKGIISLIAKQQLLFPLLALINPRAQFVFPGFPPSPLMRFWRERVIHYVHDLFLVTRRQDLGLKARLYMAWPFRRAVEGLKHFLVNSEKTRAELEPYVKGDADIQLYRPPVGNVFELEPGKRALLSDAPRPLRLVAVGTVEPRKNFAYAAAIRDALAGEESSGTTLDIVGRPGWGGEGERLAGHDGVNLRGYLPISEARAVIAASDLYLCTSHDEGLGLPLLEVQYAGLAVAAPDLPVFREVLGDSAIYLPQGDARAAAAIIREALSRPGWREHSVAAALANIKRWNAQAGADAARARAMFAGHARVTGAPSTMSAKGT